MPRPKPEGTYADWMKLVNRAVEDNTDGIISEPDLPDWDSYRCWLDGFTPSEAANHAIEDVINFNF